MRTNDKDENVPMSKILTSRGNVDSLSLGELDLPFSGRREPMLNSEYWLAVVSVGGSALEKASVLFTKIVDLNGAENRLFFKKNANICPLDRNELNYSKTCSGILQAGSKGTNCCS